MNLAPRQKLLECHQYMSNKMLARTGAKENLGLLHQFFVKCTNRNKMRLKGTKNK